MTDLSRWQLHGPVRVLRREDAQWDAIHRVWLAPRGLTVVTFRPDGQFSESEFHNPDGPVARSARVYDANGRLAEEQSWMDDGPRTRVLYSYDAAGRATGAVTVAPDGSRQEAETCRYDQFGRKTQVRFLPVPPPNLQPVAYGVEGTEHSYGAPGAVTSTTVYDDREQPSEVSFHDANHVLVLRVAFSRDRDGRVLSEVARVGWKPQVPAAEIDRIPAAERAKFEAFIANVYADQMSSSTTFAYDQKGRLLERTRRMGNLMEARTTFRYDDRGNPVDEISETRDREMRLDENGAVQETKENEPRTHHVRVDYQYDGHGNWTERVVSSRIDRQSDFQRSNVERRTLTYYGEP